ncbi:MAG: hypothetical protein PHO32_05335 [Candidatus Cloacimonetes bacterium]|nr:hypothetical protein [Candidatus Cloacimonadota bacterium]
MPREIQIKSIKNRLPVRYRYSPLVRAFMLSLSAVIFAYSIFFLVRFVNADTPKFFKILPLMITFVALDSILRQTTSLNCVYFYKDRIQFSYLLKRKLEIPYNSILTMQLDRKITYSLKIGYTNSAGVKQQFKTPASFPKILEIILNIADLSPNVELNDFMAKAVEHLRSKAEVQDAEQQI